MARELKTFVDIIQDADQHNRALFDEMTEENKKLQKTIDALTRIAKTRKTWKLKNTLQVRRQKHLLGRQSTKIERLKTDNTELKTYSAQLETVIMDVQTENLELLVKLDENIEDFNDITERLADNSCAYCGRPTPRPVPTTSRGTQVKW